MAEYIEDTGTHGYDALLSGTKDTNYSYVEADEVIWFDATAEAETGFTLPDSAWIIYEVYNPDPGTYSNTPNSRGGDNIRGKAEWTNTIGTIATTLSTWKTAFDAATDFTTYKVKATHYKGSDVADVYFADEGEGFSLTGGTEEGVTDGEYTGHGSEWVITDALLADSVADEATFGTEKVVDPSFDTAGVWTIGTGASISGGELTMNTTANVTYDDCIDGLDNETVYKLEITVSEVTTAGLIELNIGGYLDMDLYVDSTGTYYIYEILYYTNANNRIYIGSTGFAGKLSACSVKEVVSGERVGPNLVTNGTFDSNSSTGWTLGSWSVANNQLENTGGTTECSYSIGTVAVGEKYKITFYVADSTATTTTDDLRVRLGGNYTHPYLYTNGTAKTYTTYIAVRNSATNTIAFDGYGADYEIDDVTVQKVLT